MTIIVFYSRNVDRNPTHGETMVVVGEEAGALCMGSTEWFSNNRGEILAAYKGKQDLNGDDIIGKEGRR